MIIIQKSKDLYSKHERWIPIVFFLLGFVFDAFMLRRIDELKTLIQQAAYLWVAGMLITVEVKELTQEVLPPRFLARVWKYREAFLHFLLGTLLNSYTIFYFKSASTVTSFIFIIILVLVLTLNEFKRFGKSQTQVHMAFWSLCLVSYFISLAPIILGFMGIVPFLSGIVASSLIFALYYYRQKKRFQQHPKIIQTHVLLPFISIEALFTVLYFAHAIPPVPLAVNYMGIFHDAKKEAGEYQLFYTRPAWKFWQNGDQTFLARPGDTVFCFVKVFSPARFNDQLQVRWLFWNEKRGWESSDAIPMQITGGREEGYRAVTKKTNFQPGDWRVQIETLDDREVGRIRFKIVQDESRDERELKMIVQ